MIFIYFVHLIVGIGELNAYVFLYFFFLLLFVLLFLFISYLFSLFDFLDSTCFHGFKLNSLQFFRCSFFISRIYRHREYICVHLSIGTYFTFLSHFNNDTITTMNQQENYSMNTCWIVWFSFRYLNEIIFFSCCCC